jgi:TfoX/Sxy family transcriptional regulator of competence genes
MAWNKSPAALVEQFGAVLPVNGAVVRRQMMGYPSAVVRGHMFAGLFEEHMILRLNEADLQEFAEQEGATPFEPMPGRPMRGFAAVPPAVLADAAKLDVWVAKAFANACSLPEKQPKARRTAKKKAG